MERVSEEESRNCMTKIRTARLPWIYFTIFVANAVVLEVLSFVLSRSRSSHCRH
jgi:hypothetical protein